MTGKQIVGVGILVAVLAAVMAPIVAEAGVLKAIGTLLLSVFFALVALVGIYLVTDGK